MRTVASSIASRTLLEVERLKELLNDRATYNRGSPSNENAYIVLRSSLRSNAAVYRRLPECVRTCSSLQEFWTYIRDLHGTYDERREYLRVAFTDVIEYCEEQTIDRPIVDITDTIDFLNSDSIEEHWQRILQRRDIDPAGAITAARSLLESVLKHILDDESEEYSKNDDLPALWKSVARILNMLPASHEDPDLKQILGGCQSVIQGLSNLRNVAGDAHGSGRRAMRVLPRHAELAVNLSGTMSAYLLKAWQSRTVRDSNSTPPNG